MSRRPFALVVAAALTMPALFAGLASAQDADVSAASAAAEVAAGDAAAEAGAAESTADTAQDAADAALGEADAAEDAGSLSAGDAVEAADAAQDAADVAAEDADTASTDAADAADAVDTFNGRIRHIRMLKNLSGSGSYRIIATVADDELNEVRSIETVAEPEDGGPAMTPTAATLLRIGSGYDAAGSLRVDDDGSGGTPQPGSGIQFGISPFIPNALAYYDPSPDDGSVWENVQQPPEFIEGTSFVLQSIAWSSSPDCELCPTITLADLSDPNSPEHGVAPPEMTLYAEPTNPDEEPWTVVFGSWIMYGQFEDTGMEYELDGQGDVDALGFSYTLTSTMLDEANQVLGEPSTTSVTVEAEGAEDPEPEPEPTLLLDGTTNGNVTIDDGDYVLLVGDVTKSVKVKGGTLVIQGGSIGKDLKLEGGTVVLDGATIGRNLKAKSGAIEVGQGVIGRDLDIKGAVVMSGTEDSLLVIEHDLKGRTSKSVTLGGNLDVQHRVRWRSGDLIVNDTIWAEGDVDMRVRGNGSGGILIDGPITSFGGDIKLRTDNSTGGLIVNDTIWAEGDVDMRIKGGGFTLDGAVTAMEDAVFRFRDMDEDSFGNYQISGDITAGGDVSFRVKDSGGELTIDGDVTAGDSVTFRNKHDDYTHWALNGSINADQGELEMRLGGGDVDINGTVTAGTNVDFDKDGPGATTVGGNIIAGGDIKLKLKDGPLVVYGGLGPAVGECDMRIDGGNVDINGTITAGTNVTLRQQGTGDVTVDGTINAGGGVYFRNKYDDYNNYVVNGSINAVGEVDMRISGGEVDINGTLTAGTNIDVSKDGPGDVTFGGPVSAYGFLIIDTISSTSSATVHGLDDNTPDATRPGGINIGEASTIEAASVELSSGDNVNVDGTVYSSGGAVIFNADTTITVSGDVEAGSDIDFDSVGDTTINGTLTSGGDIDVNSLGDTSVGGDLVALEHISVTCTGWESDSLVSGGQGVTISTIGSFEMLGGSVESSDGFVDLFVTVDLAAGTATGEGSDTLSSPVLVSGGAGVTISAGETADLTGATVESSGGAVTILGRRLQTDSNQAEVWYMDIDAGTDITIITTEYFELTGVLTWGGGAFSWDLTPFETAAVDGFVFLEFRGDTDEVELTLGDLGGLKSKLLDPGALLAAVTGG